MGTTPAARFGFPKEARFRCREDFQHLWTVGRKQHTPHFLIYWAHSDVGQTQGRLGVTVSRKVGNAVVRNRIKRLVRERFRLLRPRIGAIDLSIIAKRSASDVVNPILSAEIDQFILSLIAKMAAV